MNGLDKHIGQRSILHLAIGCLLILSFILKFWEYILWFLDGNINFDSFELTEFLINYQGGFVRRGLVGEILYLLYPLCDHLDIRFWVSIFCFIIFFAVVSFFLIGFHRKRYCWWILFSPLLLNFPYYLIRKDFLMYGLFISSICCLRKASPSLKAKILATILMIIALLIHEPVIFWGMPIFILLMWSFRKDKVANRLLIALSLATFVLLVIFKGTPETASLITDSWNSIIPGSPVIHHPHNAIGALGWDPQWAFSFHWETNKGENHSGQLLIPVIAFGAYYMFSNFLSVFNDSKRSSETLSENKSAISLLYSSTMLCLIPMLTILSCDVGRVFQYAGIATFATFLLLPAKRIVAIYPGWYRKLIVRFNRILYRYLPAGKGWLLFLLFFLAISPTFFSLNQNLSQSLAGTLWEWTIYLRRTFAFI